MKATLMALSGAAAFVAATTSGTSAQVLNLSGQFSCVQGCVAAPTLAPAYVTQADWTLNLVNEAGIPARAWIDRPGHFWVDGWNQGGVYSPDGMTIQFDRGTVWQRIVALPLPPGPPPRFYHRRVYHRHDYHPRPLPAANS
jgi:hypothetical protein